MRDFKKLVKETGMINGILIQIHETRYRNHQYVNAAIRKGIT